MNSISKIDERPEGKSIIAEFPRNLYVTVLASTVRSGSFKLTFWGQDNNPLSMSILPPENAALQKSYWLV